jgi:serine/threonine-protein kinase HipA
MKNELHVWIYPPGELVPRHCGTLDFIGGRQCLFSYSESWLSDRQAFQLSPDLPLRSGASSPSQGSTCMRFSRITGPDRWGRRVIDTAFRPECRPPIDYLGPHRSAGFLVVSRELRNAEGLRSPARDRAFYAADLEALVNPAHAVEIH